MNLVYSRNSRKAVNVPGVPRKVIRDDSTKFSRDQITEYWDIKIRNWNFNWD